MKVNMNSKTKILIGILIALIGGVLVAYLYFDFKKNPATENFLVKGEPNLILWNKGEKINLNQYPFVKEIQEKCEEIIEGADSAYKLAVRENLIKKLREKEISIEIIYNSPREFFPLYWQTRTKPKKLQILRLLIPLTGRFSHPVTIFYGTPEDKLPNGALLEYGEFNDLINNYAENKINYIKQILQKSFKIEFKEN